MPQKKQHIETKRNLQTKPMSYLSKDEAVEQGWIEQDAENKVIVAFRARVKTEGKRRTDD